MRALPGGTPLLALLLAVPPASSAQAITPEQRDPGLFAPAELDCGQWADSAREAGMSYLVLTAKHTEGISAAPAG